MRRNGGQPLSAEVGGLLHFGIFFFCQHVYHHSCSLCDKSFRDSSSLRTYSRVIQGRPFSCSLFKKSFALSEILKAHIRIHTEEKPLSCSFFDKTFSDPSTLRQHSRLHNRENHTVAPNCLLQARNC